MKTFKLRLRIAFNTHLILEVEAPDLESAKEAAKTAYVALGEANEPWAVIEEVAP